MADANPNAHRGSIRDQERDRKVPTVDEVREAMRELIRDKIWMCALECRSAAVPYYQMLLEKDQTGSYSERKDSEEENLRNIIKQLDVTGYDIKMFDVTYDYVTAEKRREGGLLQSYGELAFYQIIEDPSDLQFEGMCFKWAVVEMVYNCIAMDFGIYPAEDFDAMCVRESAPQELDPYLIPDLAAVVMEYL